MVSNNIDNIYYLRSIHYQDMSLGFIAFWL